MLLIVIGYLIGSVPFGYLIVRVKEGADVRQTGSGGTGATNVSRRAGKGAAVLTLILDALKGSIAIILARWCFGLTLFNAGGQSGSARPPAEEWVAAVAIAVIVGHIFPVWLGFRGGKGVATGLGVFIMFSPIAVAVAALVFLLIVWLTRFVSLGSIVAAATIPLFVWLQSAFIQSVADSEPLIMAAIAGGLLIIFAHRENIRRLIQGTENKFR